MLRVENRHKSKVWIPEHTRQKPCQPGMWVVAENLQQHIGPPKNTNCRLILAVSRAEQPESRGLIHVQRDAEPEEVGPHVGHAGAAQRRSAAARGIVPGAAASNTHPPVCRPRWVHICHVLIAARVPIGAPFPDIAMSYRPQALGFFCPTPCAALPPPLSSYSYQAISLSLLTLLSLYQAY